MLDRILSWVLAVTVASGTVVVLPPGEVMFDSFDRSGAGLVATTPDGYDWDWGTGAGYAEGYTNGAEFVVNITAANRLLYGYFDASTNGVPAPLKQNEFSFLTRFKQDVIVSGASDYVRFLWYGPGYENQVWVGLQLQKSWYPGYDMVAILYLRNEYSGRVPFPFGDIEANEWYLLRVDVKAGEYGRLKFWKESSGEPDEWLIDLVDGVPATDVSGCILWDWSNELQSNGQTLNRTYDYLKFGGESDPVTITGSG